MENPGNTFIIAEMACSHDGNEDLARHIIDGAGRGGADSVQLQVWKAENVMVPNHPAMPTLESLELSAESWKRIAQFSRDTYPGMDLIGCVYDPEAVELCLDLGVDAFKIHSADLSNPKLLRIVAATGKRIDLSVGGSSLDEIQRALDVIRLTSDSSIWMMYGFQLFPTPTEVINLRFIRTLRDLFGLPVGYQDHSDPTTKAALWMPAAAVGFGATILEKHLTHDRSKKGADHQAAFNPGEFARFVKMVHKLDAAAGRATPRPFSGEELEYRKYAKKSLVAARDLPAGYCLEEGDLLARRAPELGEPPERADLLVGKRLRNDVRAFELVTVEKVQ